MLILLPVNQVFTVDELDAGEELNGYRENCLQRELPAKKGKNGHKFHNFFLKYT